LGETLPDVIGVGDIDALERRFPPWRPH
jgi:hypothetical protein